uniref:Uncharacterized protein n=1 Tax=Strix occidentalis caurina TaxID=311401 RepID=A0A8D0FW34_STROC
GGGVSCGRASARLRPLCVCVWVREKARGRAGCGGSSRRRLLPARRWACARPPVLRDRAGRRSVGAGNFLVWRRRNNTAPDGGAARRALPPPVAERCEGGAPPGPPLPPEPPAFPPSPLPSPRPTHPRPAMPDQISVSEFVSETNEDYKSPTASNFTTRMAQCRNTVAAIEEVSPGRGGAAGRGAGCAAPSGLAARRRGSREQGATGAGSCRSLSSPRPAPRSALGCR